MPLPNIPGSVLVPPKSSTTIFDINSPLKDIIVEITEMLTWYIYTHIRMYVRTYVQNYGTHVYMYIHTRILYTYTA